MELTSKVRISTMANLKAKRKHHSQAKLSGVDIEDSEMDILIRKKYQKNGRRQRPVTLVALVKKRLIQSS